MANHHACQSARHVLNVLHAFHLKAGCGQHLGGLVDGNVEGKELLKPAAEIFMGVWLGTKWSCNHLIRFFRGRNAYICTPPSGCSQL